MCVGHLNNLQCFSFQNLIFKKSGGVAIVVFAIAGSFFFLLSTKRRQMGCFLNRVQSNPLSSKCLVSNFIKNHYAHSISLMSNPHFKLD